MTRDTGAVAIPAYCFIAASIRAFEVLPIRAIYWMACAKIRPFQPIRMDSGTPLPTKVRIAEESKPAWSPSPVQ